MKSQEIRKRFFQFFEARNHTRVASSSLIPAHDPTLLFANAGMNQFKDVFLGNEKRSYTRAVSIQKCMRAGGKHNDLDNVGFTSRHLTFFEMMGNFSFGDYFKKEAIQFAWEFLTKEMKLPVEKLHVSVFHEDQESYDIWHNMIGVAPEKIHRLDAKDNFWQMGDTGPCGPCTEIHLDRGGEAGCTDPCGPACDCDRFLEIWNLVFMQFDRQPNGIDVPLQQTGVDTGMGLERLCMVMQDVNSIFNTDLFANILTAIEKLTGKQYAQQDSKGKAAFHVLADHIRSTSMLIADGCAPSNEGRGYVLRKIIRRAALFTQKLTDKNIFPELSKTVVADLGHVYPELVENQELIHVILTSEIEKFATNLVRGKAILESCFEENSATKKIDGQQAFKLYDTFGFPTELIILIAQEHGFTVNMDGFEKEMEQQRIQSGKKIADELEHITFEPPIVSEFTGYDELETTSQIAGLIHQGKPVKFVGQGEECWVIAHKSPFFIVGGGQVPDNGWLVFDGNKVPLLEVRYIDKAIAARIKAPVNLSVGDEATSIVNEELRTNAMKNHTATHMLQAALIELFGKQIKQSGSLVCPDYLRFDFTYHENLSQQDIARVEDLVNQKIWENIPVDIEYMTMKDAVDKGALAFFGDKYNPEKVRVIDIPHFSTELCGGTHVHATGDIGVFKITEMSALSAGHRRIVAVTGPKALELFQQSFNTVKQLGTDFKVQREDVYDAVTKQHEQLKAAHTQIKQLKKSLLHAQIPSWHKHTETVNNVPFGFITLEDFGHDEMRTIAQTLAQQTPGLYFILSSTDDKNLFLCLISPEIAQAVDQKKLAQWLKESHNLRGGGAKGVLQGGGPELNQHELKDAVKQWLTNQ